MPRSKAQVEGEFHHHPMYIGAEGSLLQLLRPFMNMIKPENDWIDDGCIDQGLIPSKLINSLIALRFVSATVLSAQRAQRKFGVPASVLIAMGALENSYDASMLAEGKAFAQGCTCCLPPEIDSWFMKRAKLLNSSPKFRSALPLVRQAKSYLEELLSLGFFEDRLGMTDVLDFIEQHSLQECDLAAEMMPGEFSRSLYPAFLDGRGQLDAPGAADVRGEVATCTA